MKDIKFRGKSLSTGEWVYGYYVYCAREVTIYNPIMEHRIYTIGGSYFVVDPTTVGQYIGRKDINEVEVYEDDICDGHSDGLGRIVYHNIGCEYIYVFADGNSVGLWETENLEVIGSIHDNPTLLTQ